MTMTADGPGLQARRRPEIRRHAFPLLAKVLHWTTAALVLTMFCVGILMTELGNGPWADALMTFHKTTGFVLLILVVTRLGYRVLARLRGRWLRSAGGRVVHRILYALLLLIPLLGLAGVSDFGAREIYGGLSLPAIWPQGAGYADLLFRSHAILAFILLSLVALHICLALDDYIQHVPQAEAGQDGAPAVKPSSIRRPDMP